MAYRTKKQIIDAAKAAVPQTDKPKVVVGEIITPVSNSGLGNQSKLTQETTERLCELLIEGNYVTTSCAAVGISYESYRRWLKLGEQENEGPYFEFYVAVTQARALGEALLLQTIKDASRQPQHWAAAAWILERTKPDRFGKSNRIELIARERIRERAEEEGLDADEVAALAARLALEAGEEADDDSES